MSPGAGSAGRTHAAPARDDGRRFASRVLAAVRRIPPGRVATYGDVAAAAGSPRAHRAVGNIMRDCRAPDVPCHRVIAAAGRLGGYGAPLELKRALLRAEGLVVSTASVRDFISRRWTSRPERRDRSSSVQPAKPRRHD